MFWEEFGGMVGCAVGAGNVDGATVVCGEVVVSGVVGGEEGGVFSVPLLLVGEVNDVGWLGVWVIIERVYMC